ncbi:unnamed protein product [marine sediment metagenome]|uniref:Uncharacterized protein n=1 Tax=marine sediment metagenome TaxID=412755 RepID=X1IRT8_9ZZZZ
MPSLHENEPQVRILRKQRYNPNFEDYQKEEFPTNTIKRAGRIGGVDGGTLITSYSTGPGSYIQVTRLDICADRETEFYIRDRTGTVDFIFLEAAGMHSVIGDQYAPVMVLKGSCEFRSLDAGSAGTYCISFEGIVPQFGTQALS